MPLGFGLPVSGSWATPAAMVHVARRAEELGYSSLWSFQRVLYPAEGSLDPAWDDAHNPAKRSARDASYQQVHEPLLALAHVASHTERIRLGTATICAPFTPPALLAKSVVTMDHLSGGGSRSASASAGCRTSTPPRACRTSGAAPGWRSTCAASTRC